MFLVNLPTPSNIIVLLILMGNAMVLIALSIATWRGRLLLGKDAENKAKIASGEEMSREGFARYLRLRDALPIPSEDDVKRYWSEFEHTRSIYRLLTILNIASSIGAIVFILSSAAAFVFSHVHAAFQLDLVGVALIALKAVAMGALQAVGTFLFRQFVKSRAKSTSTSQHG